jgi:hypothetical protein
MEMTMKALRGITPMPHSTRDLPCPQRQVRRT